MIAGMTSNLPRLLVAFVFAAAVPSLALSQTAPARPAAKPPAKTGSFGQGKGPLLTRAELRECLAQQERIKGRNEAAAKEREALEKEKADIVEQGSALKEQLGSLDRTNAEAVQQYNTSVTERDRRIDAFEARMPEFNGKVEALQKDREAFERQCGNRRYDEEDEIAIRKGR